jgi:hypothetical protein
MSHSQSILKTGISHIFNVTRERGEQGIGNGSLLVH